MRDNNQEQESSKDPHSSEGQAPSGNTQSSSEEDAARFAQETQSASGADSSKDVHESRGGGASQHSSEEPRSSQTADGWKHSGREYDIGRALGQTGEIKPIHEHRKELDAIDRSSQDKMKAVFDEIPTQKKTVLEAMDDFLTQYALRSDKFQLMRIKILKDYSEALDLAGENQKLIDAADKLFGKALESYERDLARFVKSESAFYDAVDHFIEKITQLPGQFRKMAESYLSWLKERHISLVEMQRGYRMGESTRLTFKKNGK